MSTHKDSKRLTSLRTQVDLLARSQLWLREEERHLQRQRAHLLRIPGPALQDEHRALMHQLREVEIALERLVRQCVALAQQEKR